MAAGSDEAIPGDDASRLERRERLDPGVVTQQEIDDVLSDARLSPAEREARLADLRQRILDDEYARGDEEYAPLQMQIMDALSMLAEGGHDYVGHGRVEGEESDNGEDAAGDRADRDL